MNPILQALKKGENSDDVNRLFYTLYRHLSMLKEEGLIE